jgi:hypothetical protein
MKAAWTYVAEGTDLARHAFEATWKVYVRRVQSNLLLLAFVHSRLLVSHEQEERPLMDPLLRGSYVQWGRQQVSRPQSQQPPRHDVLLAAASRGHELVKLVMPLLEDMSWSSW